MEEQKYNMIGIVEEIKPTTDKNGDYLCKLIVDKKTLNVGDANLITGLNIGDRVDVQYTVSSYKWNEKDVQSKHVRELKITQATQGTPQQQPLPVQQVAQPTPQPVQQPVQQTQMKTPVQENKPSTTLANGQPDWETINALKALEEAKKQGLIEKSSQLRAKVCALECAKDIGLAKGSDDKSILVLANALYTQLLNTTQFDIDALLGKETSVNKPVIQNPVTLQSEAEVHLEPVQTKNIGQTPETEGLNPNVVDEVINI